MTRSTFLCLLLGLNCLSAEPGPPAAPAWEPVAMNISKPTRGQSVATRLQWAKAAGFRAQHEIGFKDPAAMVKDYEAAGMRLGAVYLYFDADKGNLPAGLAEALEQVKGQRPQLWLAFNRPGTAAHEWDERLVGIIREAAALAAKHEMQVVLYPHHQFYAATIDDVLRLAKLADRPNVGIAFNLCHFLRCERGADWRAALERAGRHLFAVTLSGAQVDGADWPQLIQPLDRGDFPLGDLLAELKRGDFRGTVAVQDFGIDADPVETLSRSYQTYQKLVGGR